MDEPSRKKRILLVEDEMAVQRVLSFFLEQHGFEVCAAFSGQEALHLIPNFEPDLIILDLVMYPLSGWDVLQWLSRRHVTPCLPVLVMSALVHLSLQVRAFEAGASEYVTKPVQPSVVVERVHALLAMTAEERARLQHERIDEQRKMLARMSTPLSDEFV